jgi:hypothetical protein
MMGRKFFYSQPLSRRSGLHCVNLSVEPAAEKHNLRNLKIIIVVYIGIFRTIKKYLTTLLIHRAAANPTSILGRFLPLLSTSCAQTWNWMHGCFWLIHILMLHFHSKDFPDDNSAATGRITNQSVKGSKFASFTSTLANNAGRMRGTTKSHCCCRCHK